MKVFIKKLYPEVTLPSRAYPSDVGFDLHAFLLTESGRKNNLLVPPRTTRPVPTGIALEPYWESDPTFIMVCSRSGLASQSIFVANAPGIVDPGYRGEIMVLLYNGSHESYYVQHGQRIAQLILTPALVPELIQADQLSESPRGEKGFGSSGV